MNVLDLLFQSLPKCSSRFVDTVVFVFVSKAIDWEARRLLENPRLMFGLCVLLCLNQNFIYLKLQIKIKKFNNSEILKQKVQ